MLVIGAVKQVSHTQPANTSELPSLAFHAMFSVDSRTHVVTPCQINELELMISLPNGLTGFLTLREISGNLQTDTHADQFTERISVPDPPPQQR